MPLRRTLRSGETVEVSHPIERSEAFWGHGRDPNDQAWSNSIQRRDAVIARAPAAAEAWSLVDTVNLRSSIVPVDLATAPYVPAGEPFASGVEVVDHYAEHPEHGAGIVTGPQGAGWGLLAICDDSGAGWASWVNANAFDTKRVDGKYDKPKGLRNYDVNHDRIQRPLGTKVEVMWELIPDDQTDQYHLPRVRTFRGNVDHLGLAALASMTVATTLSPSFFVVTATVAPFASSFNSTFLPSRVTAASLATAKFRSARSRWATASCRAASVPRRARSAS